MYVQFHITDKCNLKCKHCYDSKIQMQTMKITDFKNCIDKIVTYIFECEGTLENSKITLIGGEPLILSNFLDYFNYCVDKFGVISIATNGTLLTKEFCKYIAKYNARVQVSIDGDKETNDYIRGNGTYEKILGNAKIAKDAGIIVLCSYTLNNLNIDKVMKFYEDINGKDYIDYVWFDRMIPFQTNSGLEIPSKKQFAEFIDVCQEIFEGIDRGIYKQKIQMNRALQFLTGRAEHPYVCSAGKNITVTPSGDLLACRRMPIVLGNMFTKSLKEIFETKCVCDIAYSVRKIPKECEMCSYKENCRGGLKCMTYALNKSVLKKDFHCPLELGVN